MNIPAYSSLLRGLKEMLTAFNESGVINPPIVNRATNPKANTIGVVYRIDPP